MNGAMDLVNYQAEAINLANLTESAKKQTVVLAAKTGSALLKVKEMLPHGEYTPWVNENMPVNQRQCQKYTKLAQQRPELLSNAHLNAHLDVDSELKLLSLDDETANTVRDIAEKEDLTQKQIAEKKQLKSGDNNILMSAIASAK